MPQQDPRFIPDDPRFIPDNELPRDPGLLSKAWTAASTPIANLRGQEGSFIRTLTDKAAEGNPIMGGFNFATDLVSGLSSPLNLAFGGLGTGEVAAARYGLPVAGKLAQIGRRVLSVPVVAEGAQNLYEGLGEGNIGQGIMGGLELGGGLLGLRKGNIGKISAKTSTEIPQSIESSARMGPAPTQLTPEAIGPSLRPPVNPGLANALRGELKPESLNLENMPGNRTVDTTLNTIEGVQAAYNSGKISQQTAIGFLKDIHSQQQVVGKLAKQVKSTESVIEPIIEEQPPTTRVEPKTYIFGKDEVNPEFIKKAREQGYEFQGLNDQGDYRFSKVLSEIEPTISTVGPLANEPIITKPQIGIPEATELIKSGEVRNVADLQRKTGKSFEETRKIWYGAKEELKNALQEMEADIPGVKALDQLPTPKGLGDVIKAIPRETGDEVLDNMVQSLRAMRRRKGIDEFNDLETRTYNSLLKNIQNHPNLPQSLKERWNKIISPVSTPSSINTSMEINQIPNRVIPRKMSPDVTINLMRGAHDPVRVVFADSTDKLVFQALARNREGGFKNPGMLETLEANFPNVSPQQLREAAHQYRIEVLTEAKNMPKQAESGIVGELKIEPKRTFRDVLNGLVKNEKGELTIDLSKFKKNLSITSVEATTENVKKLYEKGYRFTGTNERGEFQFQNTGITGKAPILESEVGANRPTKKALMGELGAVQDAKKSSIIAEAFNLPRGLLASIDLSAPLRQGIALIHKKAFWTSFEPMLKSWKSEEGFQASQNSIANRPLFKKRLGNTGDILPSFADDAGLKLTDLTDLSKREEAIMSTWAEKVPGVRPSNRAYTAFLNNLRADVFEDLIKNTGVLTDVKNNLPLARSLADFVNTASGRGSLGKLEASAVALNTALFAPRLIASRVKMLNPAYYIMANPTVRKEALKSLLAITTVGNTVLGLAKMAGAEVSLDSTNSDFRKAKIGNVRIDPWGGFQQYIVAASRLISGKTTSSISGRESDLTNPRGPYGQTYLDIIGRFGRGKLNPVISFAYSLLAGQKEMSGQKMNLTTMNPMDNAVTQRFIPLLIQDVYQIAQENPNLLPLAIPAAFGMGLQSYSSIK